MKGVVIAAGRGSRFRETRESKPLCPVLGRALIEWVVLSARQAGIRDFVVVTGYAREKVEPYLADLARREGITVSFVFNDEWEKENGLSVAKAEPLAGDKFALMMSDHIFDPDILALLMTQPVAKDETILAVDANVAGHPSVDLDDVTKVMVEDGKILAIGKTIEAYNAFDTGMFLGTTGLFRALAESRKRGDFSLSGGMRVLMEGRKALAMDVGRGFWIDVDDERAREKAEALLAARGASGPPEGKRRP
ncbi:MAG: NTP transferase domain-containing protein [Acidobacteriota bacterium]